RLKNNLEPRKLIRFYLWIDDSVERYEGEVLDGYFYMKRINFRSGALFTIFGKIGNRVSNREIHIKMKYKKSDLIGAYAFLSFIGSIALLGLLIQLINGTFQLLDLAPLLIFLFGLLIYFLAFSGFDDETKKCLEYLKRLLDAEEVANAF